MLLLRDKRLIFLKTRKTAGTSLEVFLGRHRGARDIVTRVTPPVEGHAPQNNLALFLPLRDSRLSGPVLSQIKRAIGVMLSGERFYNHMPASEVKRALPRKVWDEAVKFAVERNPWDKVVSMYFMVKTQRPKVTINEIIDRMAPVNYRIYGDVDSRTLLVDRVLRYEHLTDELAELLPAHDIPFDGDLGVRAKGGFRTDRRSYREILTDDEAARIAEHFALEITLMGYRYDAPGE